MHQLTTETISEDIISKYIPQKINLREKLIRKINEHYQYHPDTYIKVVKGDYSFITKLLDSHIFHYC